jgi:hypothetical protein
MTEDEPFKGDERLEPTKVPLTGPNVKSTFDTPLRADALKAQDAAIRRHLESRRNEQGPRPPDAPGGDG